MAVILPLQHLAELASVFSLLDITQDSSQETAARQMGLLDAGYYASISEKVLKRITENHKDYLTDILLKALAPPSLKELRINACQQITSDGVIAIFHKCQNLQLLDLSHCDHLISISLFESICSLPHLALSAIILEACDNVTDQVVQCLLTGAPNLKQLKLCCCSSITDKVFLINERRQLSLELSSVDPLFQVKFGVVSDDNLMSDFQCGLVSVDVSGCNLTSTAIRHLATLSGPSLRHVDISYSKMDPLAMWYLSGYSFPSALQMLSTTDPDSLTLELAELQKEFNERKDTFLHLPLSSQELVTECSASGGDLLPGHASHSIQSEAVSHSKDVDRFPMVEENRTNIQSALPIHLKDVDSVPMGEENKTDIQSTLLIHSNVVESVSMEQKDETNIQSESVSLLKEVDSFSLGEGQKTIIQSTPPIHSKDLHNASTDGQKTNIQSTPPIHSKDLHNASTEGQKTNIQSTPPIHSKDLHNASTEGQKTNIQSTPPIRSKDLHNASTEGQKTNILIDVQTVCIDQDKDEVDCLIEKKSADQSSLSTYVHTSSSNQSDCSFHQDLDKDDYKISIDKTSVDQSLLTSVLAPNTNQSDCSFHQDLDRNHDKVDSQTLTEKKSVDQSLTEKKSVDQSFTEKKSVDQSLTEKKSVDQSLTEKKSVDQSFTEKKSVDQSFTEKKSVDQSFTEKKSDDQSLTEKKSVDQSFTEKKSVDQSLTEKKSVDQSLTEKKSVDQSLLTSDSRQQGCAFHHDAIDIDLPMSTNIFFFNEDLLPEPVNIPFRTSQNNVHVQVMLDSLILNDVQEHNARVKDSESEAANVKDSESEAANVKDSESEAASVKDSESEAASVKDSESEAASVKDSESEAASVKDSESEAVSIKNSESEAVSIKDSESEATSIKNSQTEASDNISTVTDSKSEEITIIDLETVFDDTSNCVKRTRELLARTDNSIQAKTESLHRFTKLFSSNITSFSACRIVISDSRYCRICVEHFFKLNQDIKRLELTWRSLTNEALCCIAKYLSQLKTLMLVDCDNVSDSLLRVVGVQCQKIEKLDLKGVCFFDDGIPVPFLLNKYLRSLSLSESRITNLTMQFIQKSASSRIVDLDFSWCEDISEEGVNCVAASCTALRILNLRHCPATDTTLHLLADNCHQLENVELSGVQDITDDAVMHLINNVPLLQIIDISWNVALTDASVMSLFRYCPLLKVAKLSGMKRLTSDAFTPIISDYPRWQKCEALIRFKSRERDLLQKMGDEQYSSDEEYEALYVPHRSTVYAPSLQRLELEYCNYIDDEKLQEIVCICRGSLSIIDYYCEKVTASLGHLPSRSQRLIVNNIRQ